MPPAMPVEPAQPPRRVHGQPRLDQFGFHVCAGSGTLETLADVRAATVTDDEKPHWLFQDDGGRLTPKEFSIRNVGRQGLTPDGVTHRVRLAEGRHLRIVARIIVITAWPARRELVGTVQMPASEPADPHRLPEHTNIEDTRPEDSLSQTLSLYWQAASPRPRLPQTSRFESAGIPRAKVDT